MTIKKLGVLGDVHAEDETLLAALEFFAAVGVDRVVCVGDVIDGAGDAERCISALRSREITTVRGNHERWFVEGRSLGCSSDRSARRASSALPARSWWCATRRRRRPAPSLGTRCNHEAPRPGA